MVMEKMAGGKDKKDEKIDGWLDGWVRNIF